MSNAGWQYVESLFSISKLAYIYRKNNIFEIFLEVEFNHYPIDVTLFYIHVKQCDNGRHKG